MAAENTSPPAITPDEERVLHHPAMLNPLGDPQPPEADETTVTPVRQEPPAEEPDDDLDDLDVTTTPAVEKPV